MKTNQSVRHVIAMISAILLFINQATQAQVKFGDNKTSINAGSLLELESSTSPYKGLLLPRISISTTTTWTLNGSGVAAMMIYNTNTSISSSNTSYPILPGGKGMYFWDGTGWIGMQYGNQFWSLTGNSGTNSGTNFIGTTDNHPLLFKVNKVIGGYIDSVGGNGNAFFGEGAGYKNTTGTANTLIGTDADSANTTANAITAVGYQAAALNTALGLTAVGYQAGYSNNSTAINNTFMGMVAGTSNTTGKYNTFLGSYAGNANTTGSNNTFNGNTAGSLNTTGSNNLFVGSNAGSNNSTGSSNVYIGYSAGSSGSTGGSNLATGYYAAVNITTGANNVMLGYNSASTLKVSNNNTLVGYGADISADSYTNATAIGYQAKVNQSNSLVLGSTGANAVNVGIGNIAPQQLLQLSGTSASSAIGTTGVNLITPTARIDGLNSTNNSVHQSGDNEPRPVYVSRNGDLVVAPSTEVVFSDDNFISNTSTVTISLASGGTGINSTTQQVYTTNFTLNRRAVVCMNYELSHVYNDYGGASIADGIGRSMRSYIKLVNATTSATVNNSCAIGGSYYYNSVNASSILNGFFVSTGNYNLELPAGTYTIQLFVVLAAGAGKGSALTFGGTSDQIQVVAHYK